MHIQKCFVRCFFCFVWSTHIKERKISWEPFQLAQPIHPNLVRNGLDWLCYLVALVSGSHNLFHIFSIFFWIKKIPQNTFARKFSQLISDGIGGVYCKFCNGIVQLLQKLFFISVCTPCRKQYSPKYYLNDLTPNHTYFL